MRRDRYDRHKARWLAAPLAGVIAGLIGAGPAVGRDEGWAGPEQRTLAELREQSFASYTSFMRLLGDRLGDRLPADKRAASVAAFKTAYEQGVEEAEAELAEGRATIYSYGLPGDRLDRETGLPYRTIAGCAVDSSIEGRAAGHNDRIEAHVAVHGPPPNSYKRWEEILFNLERHFEGRVRDEEPHPLIVGGPAAASPDGRYTVGLVADPESAMPHWSPRLVIEPAGGGPPAVLDFVLLSSPAEVIFGPEGSHLAFFREGDEEGWFYHAVDLEAGRDLRSDLAFRDPVGPELPREEIPSAFPGLP